MIIWIQSEGTLEYGPGLRVALAADQGIADFYLAMIPRSREVNPQRYGAHVSVVRDWEKPPNMSAFGLHQGEMVEFEYEPIVCNDDKYFWLNVRCARIQDVREELGLSRFAPWRNGYHLTVGNVKPGTGASSS